MKPDWKDAPAWAKFLAMDSDGIWSWYENEPLIEREDDCYWTTLSESELWLTMPETQSYWKNSLEERPKSLD